MKLMIKRVLVIALLTLPLGAIAATIDLLVPAYSNPCCDGPAGSGVWDQLIETAASGSITLRIIFNPASGPGSSVDLNYVDITGTNGPLPDLRDAGGIVYGYIATTFGSRNIAAVKVDVDKYFFDLYAGLIDGIFFDEMSNDLADVAYYLELRNYVKSKHSNAPVIGNPGTTFTINLTGQSTYTVDDYANSMDTLITFENTEDQYLTNYTPPSWGDHFTSDHFGHIIHGTQGTGWSNSLVELASNRNAGMLYVTDDILPNPFDTLPSYWGAQVEGIAAYNNTVPEPSTVLLLSMGGILLLVGRRKKM